MITFTALLILQASDIDDSPTSFLRVWLTSRTLMGALTPLDGGIGAPHLCPFGVGCKLPLPLYADVRIFR